MFKQPFSFDGRIRRTEYCLSILIYGFCASIIGVAVLGSPIAFLIYIPAIWFLWAQSAKRCHDRGNSGWWQLIPFYGLWLMFADGIPGVNEYGPNPKEAAVNYYNSNNYNNYNNVNSNNGGYSSNNEYKGGYNGGHNAGGQQMQQNQAPQNQAPQKQGGEYNSGDLYK